MTVGVEFVSRTITIENQTIKLQIWDTVFSNYKIHVLLLIKIANIIRVDKKVFDRLQDLIIALQQERF
jgi:hypothetical protein